MNDNIPIRSDVPISMHPGVLAGEAKVLDTAEPTVGRQALAAGREGLTALYSCYGQIEEAEQAMRRASNGRPAEDGRDELAAAAKKAYDRAFLTVERRVAELTKLRDGLGAKVATAIDDPNRKTIEGLSVATSIREHAKSLPDAKRFQFARAAVAAGDLRTVSALLAAPAYLSGLTDEQLAVVRDQAAQRFAAQDHAQHAATSAVITRVEDGLSRLMVRLGKVGSPTGPRAKAKAALAKLSGGDAK
jgi:hypothetical protein